MERDHQPKKAITVIKKKDRSHQEKNETSHISKHESDYFKTTDSTGPGSGDRQPNGVEELDADRLQ